MRDDERRLEKEPSPHSLQVLKRGGERGLIATGAKRFDRHGRLSGVIATAG